MTLIEEVSVLIKSVDGGRSGQMLRLNKVAWFVRTRQAARKWNE